MMFKDVVEKVLKGEFAYKNGQPQPVTISKITVSYTHLTLPTKRIV